VSLPRSSTCYIQLEEDRKVKTSFGGPFPKKGFFDVSSFYSVLACNDGLLFPWKCLALRKILSMDEFRLRHVIAIDRCCMWKRNGESVDHLLLHFDVACALSECPF
jgi:hypothetical protein